MRTMLKLTLLLAATAAFGQGGPWWQSDAAAAKQDEVRQACWQLWSLQQVQPVDPAALAAQEAKIEALRQELWAIRAEERATLAPGAGVGVRQAAGQGAFTPGQGGFAPGQGRGRMARQGNGSGRGQGNGYGRGRGGGGGPRYGNCPYGYTCPFQAN